MQLNTQQIETLLAYLESDLELNEMIYETKRENNDSTLL